MQLPIGAETEFKGVVDLIEMKALVWRDEQLGAQWDVVEIPADLKEQAAEYREKLIEAAVEIDEAATEAYLEGNMPDNDQIRALDPQRHDRRRSSSRCSAVRHSRTRAFSPCSTLLSTSCRRRSTFLPSRASTSKTEARNRASSPTTEPLSMLAFKIMNDPFVGSLTFCRIYSGKLEQGHLARQHGQGKARTRRPYAADACQQPRRHRRSLCRRHRRSRRPQGYHHG